MAASGKYGKISISKIGEDEPIFVLRAQDKLALPIIEMYKILVGSHGLQISESLQKEIETFRQWRGKGSFLINWGTVDSKDFWINYEK